MSQNPFAPPLPDAAGVRTAQTSRNRWAYVVGLSLFVAAGVGIGGLVLGSARDADRCEELGPFLAAETERYLRNQVTSAANVSSEVCDSTASVAVRLETPDRISLIDDRLAANGCRLQVREDGVAACTVRLPSGNRLSVDVTRDVGGSIVIGAVDLNNQ